MTDPLSGLHRLVFVRHGEQARNPSGTHTDALTSLGRQQAHSAGRWLRSWDITPDIILHTATGRTHQTAEGLAEALGIPVPVRRASPPSGWRGVTDPARAQELIEQRLSDWASHLRQGVLGQDPIPLATLVFVGHHTAQLSLRAAVGAGVPGLHAASHGAVFVCKRVAGLWELERYTSGGPPP